MQRVTLPRLPIPRMELLVRVRAITQQQENALAAALSVLLEDLA